MVENENPPREMPGAFRSFIDLFSRQNRSSNQSVNDVTMPNLVESQPTHDNLDAFSATDFYVKNQLLSICKNIR